MDPMFPFPALPGVKKLTTDAGAAVPGEPKAEATPALPPLVLQTVLQLLPPPRLFFLRLAPRLASVGLIFPHKRTETTRRPELTGSQLECLAQILRYKLGVAILETPKTTYTQYHQSANRLDRFQYGLWLDSSVGLEFAFQRNYVPPHRGLWEMVFHV